MATGKAFFGRGPLHGHRHEDRERRPEAVGLAGQERDPVDLRPGRRPDQLHLRLTNTGNVTLTDPTIADDKATVSYTDKDGNAITKPDSLAPGAKLYGKATYTIAQADLDARRRDNTATAKASSGADPYTADRHDDRDRQGPKPAVIAGQERRPRRPTT